MEGHLEGTLAISNRGATSSREWLPRMVMTLVEAALGQLHNQKHPAQNALLEAASLLRQQIHAPAAGEARNESGRLLAWQARKVRDYIDGHIGGPVLVADLCALVQRSEAHFSRSFKRTFGESPHSFLVRRRVELAVRYMLTTDASLRDIALQCGFTDQAHLCKHFRKATGQTPAAWRRAFGSHQHENDTAFVERSATGARNGMRVPRGPDTAAAARVLGAAPKLARGRTRRTRSPTLSAEPLLRTGS